MSDDKKTEETADVCRMGDDLIAVVRELVQLSLLTGTNIVDHLRAILVEVGEDGKLVPTQEYFEAYHTMIDDLNEQAKVAAAAQGLGDEAPAETAEVPS
jgi:hypothetical protein